MRFKISFALALAGALTACGARDEYPHETVEAYAADNNLRQALLQKCADHITSKTPFRTQSDTDECKKAVQADQNVRLAEHFRKESAASNAAFRDLAKQMEGK